MTYEFNQYILKSCVFTARKRCVAFYSDVVDSCFLYYQNSYLWINLIFHRVQPTDVPFFKGAESIGVLAFEIKAISHKCLSKFVTKVFSVKFWCQIWHIWHFMIFLPNLIPIYILEPFVLPNFLYWGGSQTLIRILIQ